MKQLKSIGLRLLLTLGLSATVFAACNDDDKDPLNGNSNNLGSAIDTIVVINGVHWATRNVASPGSFAVNPEDYGMFYQWNCKLGWPATGDIGSITASNGATTWSYDGYESASSFDTWTLVNDPSPAGYRMPVFAEIQKLLDVNKVTIEWTAKNGVNGRKFTDKSTGNFLFLPASGYRKYNSGELSSTGSFGYYWCSKSYLSTYAYNFILSSSNVNWRQNTPRATGLSVRPVAK